LNAVISAQGLSKSYGNFQALDNMSLEVHKGRIVGLIGPNGAGKTTALRCMLGLSTFEGSLNVLGKNPHKDRISLLEDVAYIADTAVLPQWMKVEQLLEYMADVHPRFSREKAQSFLNDTDISNRQKVKTLSKGMITQLHLALAISIDAKLLVLDEPTLGLDILYRKKFYQQLLNDYFDQERTIVITTHQVEEVEHLLTDLIFIRKGQVTLDTTMESIVERFIEVEVNDEYAKQAKALGPIHQRSVMGGEVMMFENIPHQKLEPLGTLRSPSVADLFVAKMQ
jgi:ABC-2 type transport system ATP-binding protein